VAIGEGGCVGVVDADGRVGVNTSIIFMEQIWQWGRDEQSGDAVSPKLVTQLADKFCTQLVAGKGHFCALVVDRKGASSERNAIPFHLNHQATLRKHP
jgi:hypothetical protein